MTLEELARDQPKLLLSLISDAEKAAKFRTKTRLNNEVRDALFNLSATLIFVKKELESATQA